MARDIKQIKKIIDLIDRPDGAVMLELREAYGGRDGLLADVSTVERVLKYLREKVNLTITVRAHQYFLERTESRQLFYTAASMSSLTDIMTVELGEDSIIDMGAFQIGVNVTCLNEVIEALKSRREIEILYQKLSGAEEQWRSIRPMFMRWYGSHWYLFARDATYSIDEAPRTFRLDGIIQVKFGTVFSPRREDSPTFFAHKFIGVSGRDANAVVVTLHMDKHAFNWLQSTLDLKQFLLQKKPLSKPAYWWEIKLMIDPNAEFIELLSRIQADYKVIGPESFKRVFRKRLEDLLKRIS
jgi:predicted DNA-binding transcriptional regulator YafY